MPDHSKDPFDENVPPVSANPYAIPKTRPGMAAVGFDGNTAGLRGARIGFKQVYYGVLIVLFSFVMVFGLAFVLGILSAGAQPVFPGQVPGGIDGMFVLGFGVLMLLFVIGFALMIFGHFNCRSSGDTTRCQGLMTTVVVADVIAVVCWVVVFLINISQDPAEQGNVTMGLGLLLNFLLAFSWAISFFCFLFFIKRVARFMRNQSMVNRSQLVIVLFMMLFVMYLAMIFAVLLAVGLVGFGNDPAAASPVMILIGCGALIWFLAALVGVCIYASLLRGMVQSIDEIRSRSERMGITYT